MTLNQFQRWSCVSECGVRIQCLPGKMGRLESISARMQPMDHVSTEGKGEAKVGRQLTCMHVVLCY